jgi:outer membrane lipoprotein carrier protein
MMSKFRRALAVLLTLVSFPADAAVKPARLPKLLEEVEAKYTAAKTLKADFVQKNESIILQKTKTSNGKLFAKRPGKVRWETTDPEKNLLVSDGKQFWFYTPPMFEDERGQVILSKSSTTVPPLANALLSGSFSMARQMKIDQKSPSKFALIPTKKGSAGTVVRAEIEVHPEKKLIEKVILEHAGGNKSEVLLSGIQLGDALEDTLFSFKIPPNTDQVNPAKE